MVETVKKSAGKAVKNRREGHPECRIFPRSAEPATWGHSQGQETRGVGQTRAEISKLRTQHLTPHTFPLLPPTQHWL